MTGPLFAMLLPLFGTTYDSQKSESIYHISRYVNFFLTIIREPEVGLSNLRPVNFVITSFAKCIDPVTYIALIILMNDLCYACLLKRSGI